MSDEVEELPEEEEEIEEETPEQGGVITSKQMALRAIQQSRRFV